MTSNRFVKDLTHFGVAELGGDGVAMGGAGAADAAPQQQREQNVIQVQRNHRAIKMTEVHEDRTGVYDWRRRRSFVPSDAPSMPRPAAMTSPPKSCPGASAAL